MGTLALACGDAAPVLERRISAFKITALPFWTDGAERATRDCPIKPADLYSDHPWFDPSTVARRPFFETGGCSLCFQICGDDHQSGHRRAPWERPV